MNIINADTKLEPIEKLLVHPRNPRRGDIGAIYESIRENGFYGAVVAQKSTGYILAGNHRYQAAQQAGAQKIPVIWVDVDDERAIKILLADNRTNDLATYDDNVLTELLQELAGGPGLDGTGFDNDALDELLNELSTSLNDSASAAEQKYTPKVGALIYEPTGPCPSLSECYDRTRTEQLISDIDATEDIPEDVRAFLRSAAERHTAFRFDRIAEYYAHAPAHVQRLMEDSFLVIVDIDRAIELGYAKLTSDLLDLVSISRSYESEDMDDEA